MKEMAHHTGCGGTTVICAADAAHGLLRGATPVKRLGSEGKRKTNRATDVLLQRELTKNPSITEADLKKNHPQLLKNNPQQFNIASKRTSIF